MDDLTTLQQAISTLGFPVFVATWMLIRDAAEKKATRDALQALTIAVNTLTERIGRGIS